MTFDEWCESCSEAEGVIPSDNDFKLWVLQGLCGVIAGGGGGEPGGDVTVDVVAKDTTLSTDVGESALNYAVLNDSVELEVAEYASVGMQFIGAVSGGGEATFEGSLGTLSGNDQWHTIVVQDAATGLPVTTLSAAGVFIINTAVYNKVRARVSTTGTGTQTWIATRSTVPI